MKILLAASEMIPFARTGGLGDVMEALPAALQARGHDVSAVLPCYRGIRDHPGMPVQSTGISLPVQIGAKRLDAEILETTDSNGVQVFFVRRDEYFDRGGLYGEDGQEYRDNAERFIYFSKAVVELARRLLPAPDIVHVHDWQTALVPVLIKDRRLPFKSVLTIHNLAYQGRFGASEFGLTNLPGHYFTARGLEFYGDLNLLKGGILFADTVTTVSERYAREIQTPEYGSGLDVVVREHVGKLKGILNGADYRVWDPAHDPHLPKNYKAGKLEGKRVCREALLAEHGLAANPRGPVYMMVSRLAEQKGIDLLLPILDRLLANDVRLVILGEGDPGYEREFLVASRRHAERFAFRKSMDDRFSHLIQAGADLTLLPSHFEPCGLTAMYALRYGTLPIARATGGLYEIIQDYDPAANLGNGFLFYDYRPEALWDAIVRAQGYFNNRKLWEAEMVRAMGCDFSWSRAVEAYEQVFERMLKAK
ncbi:MAG: glycogen synthase GlgA [Verrucomicrobiota bacterium]|nr:glycogen synthase GlgA [Verrucomicrobiota bacterium]